MASGIGLGYLVGLTGVVAFGAVIPVVPTGAAVSVGAAISDRDPIIFALVVAFGAAGAYVGDLATYAILRVAGQPLAQRVGWLHEGATADTLAALRTRIEEHELPVLLTSRLIPGGRVPVLLAAALGGYSWRRFAVADIAAASLWSAFYAAIGLAGRAIFPEPLAGGGGRHRGGAGGQCGDVVVEAAARRARQGGHDNSLNAARTRPASAPAATSRRSSTRALYGWTRPPPISPRASRSISAPGAA
jgi:membrane protein DedA with SNARE-associated domain